MRLHEVITPNLFYHGTSVPNAASIVSMNEIKAGRDETGWAVSFTRSEKIAWEFAGIAEEREFNSFSQKPEGTPEIGALLILDGDRIRQRFPTIKPFAWDGVDDEEEERLLGKRGINNISECLIRVLAKSADVEWWANSVENRFIDFYPEFANNIRSLLQHPLFTPVDHLR